MMLAEPEVYFLSVLRSASIDTGDQVPDDVYDRESFVRVLKVGGTGVYTGRSAEVATIDFDCYAHGTKTDAHTLCQRAISAVVDSVGQELSGLSIGWPTVEGGYEVRDDGQPSHIYRIYATLTVTVHTH